MYPINQHLYYRVKEKGKMYKKDSSLSRNSWSEKEGKSEKSDINAATITTNSSKKRLTVE